MCSMNILPTNHVSLSHFHQSSKEWLVQLGILGIVGTLAQIFLPLYFSTISPCKFSPVVFKRFIYCNGNKKSLRLLQLLFRN
jgi:hypothetical protein